MMTMKLILFTVRVPGPSDDDDDVVDVDDDDDDDSDDDDEEMWLVYGQCAQVHLMSAAFGLGAPTK